MDIQHSRWRVWGCLALFTFGASAVAAGRFAGGDGTAGSPYQIASPEQWVVLGTDPNLWDKHFVLIRDLDMVAVEPNAVQPIGEVGPAPFVGVLDGRGHTISHLRIVRPDWSGIGLFGEIGQEPIDDEEGCEGHVRNLHLRDVRIQGGSVVGGLAGGLSNGTIRNCSVTGTVMGSGARSDGVGGLVGCAEGAIRDCQVAVQVCGILNVGGLVGRASGAIDSCTATVEVHGTHVVGGLAGSTSFDLGLSRCSSSGRVYGRQQVGGLAGIWDGSIFTDGVYRFSGDPEERELTRVVRCRSDCSVEGIDEVGGLVGLAYGMGQIEDCYALGPVTGETAVGGLVGRRMGGCVVRCFAASAVRGREDAGGLIGKSDPVKDPNSLEAYPPCQRIVERMPGADSDGGPRWRLVYRPGVLACFWDREASGVDRAMGTGEDGDGVTALTTAQGSRAQVFRDQGWDFETVWRMRPGQAHPRLWWEQAP